MGGWTQARAQVEDEVAQGSRARERDRDTVWKFRISSPKLWVWRKLNVVWTVCGLPVAPSRTVPLTVRSVHPCQDPLSACNNFFVCCQIPDQKNSHLSISCSSQHSTVRMDLDDRPKLSVEAEKEVTRLWRTWRTVLEMLVDRVCD